MGSKGIYFLVLFALIISSSFNFSSFVNAYATSDAKKIVLVGSSFIRPLDSHEITKHLAENNLQAEVTHLGVDMDLPSRRINALNDIISLKPDVVVYGIGYRIGINDGTHDQKFGCDVIHEDDTTYQNSLAQKTKIDEIESSISVPKVTNSETVDFSKYKAESIDQEPLSPIEVINLREDPPIDMCKELLSKELANVKEILNTLNKQGIKTIIFITPHPKAYLDRIPDYDEDYYRFMLQSIGYEFNVDVYDISHKYEEKNIYRDFVHVARNPQSSIYSQDIAEMIQDSTNHKSTNSIETYKVTVKNNKLLAQWCDQSTNSIVKFSCDPEKQVSEKITKSEIPAWIKNSAKWWAEGTISDKDFINGIQFLIKEGIVVTPPTTHSSGSGTNEIPSWVKNNAKWWAEGQIDDTAFIQGIQFLIKEGLISYQ